MTKLPRHVTYVIAGLLMGAAIAFAARKGLVEPIPRRFHVEARINWINGLTAEVAQQLSPSLPGSQIEGLWGLVDGSVDVLLMAESIRSHKVNEVTLIDNRISKAVTLDLDFPADFSIDRLDQEKPSPVFLSIQSDKEHMSYVGYPEKLDKSKKYPPHPRPLDQTSLPLRFHIGKDRHFRAAFVQKEVGESSPVAIPREFTVVSPTAIDFTSPSDRLPRTSARTAVFSCDRLPLDDDKDSTADILIYSDNLTAHIGNNRLRLGNMSREGEHRIKVAKMSHTTPISLNSWIANPFLFAVSPQTSGKKKSWLKVSGAVRYFLIKPVEGTMSVGKSKQSLVSTDQVEIIGDSMLGLVFEPDTLPELRIDGLAEYIYLNGEQLLPSRWASIDPNVRGGIVGGIIGFLASLGVLLFGRRVATRG